MSGLKIINLGGVSVQRNLFLYETENEALIVDCGIGFPEVEDFGVDILIPDFTYLLQIKDKIKGLLLTHAHEDHYSATPYLLAEMPLTVYAHPIVQGFLNNKLKDFKDVNKPKFVTIDALNEFKVGSDFTIVPYRVNHSVPFTMGFFINTPFANLVHQTDFKFDFTPVMDTPIQVKDIAYMAKKYNPVLLLSDSLGSTTEGFTESEVKIEDTFDKVVKDARGQVFITTISSNISRIQQGINTATKFNRKVVVSGYSIENNLNVAKDLKLIEDPRNSLISESEIKNYKPHQLLYIVPGTYGQVGSTLDKVADGKHNQIKMQNGDTVIFSGDPIPGSEASVDRLIEKLVIRGAEVVYSEIQEDLHVSGHGSRGDLSLMANLVKPKYLVPIGGQLKHLRAYKDLMAMQGFDPKNVFDLLDGESILINGENAKKDKTYPIKEVYVDNSQNRSLVENIVLNDRKQLSESGVLFIVVPYINEKLVFNKPEVFTRGYFYVKENKSLMDGLKKNITSALQSVAGESDFSIVKKQVEKSVKKHLYKRVGETPLIVVEKLQL